MVFALSTDEWEWTLLFLIKKGARFGMVIYGWDESPTELDAN